MFVSVVLAIEMALDESLHCHEVKEGHSKLDIMCQEELGCDNYV